MDYGISTQEWQLHELRIACVDRYVDQILTHPHETQGTGESLLGKIKIYRYEEGKKDLESRTHRHVDKFSEKKENDMTCLVKNKIDVVDKMPIKRAQGIMQKICTK